MVYLLHFSRPINPDRPCQHYIGYAEDLAQRLDAHAAGNGARLTQVALERGIAWQLARTWRGGRDVERWIKQRRNHKSLCPICNPDPHGRKSDTMPIPVILRYKTGRIKIAATLAAFLDQPRSVFSYHGIASAINHDLDDQEWLSIDSIYRAMQTKTIATRYTITTARYGWLHVRKVGNK